MAAAVAVTTAGSGAIATLCTSLAIAAGPCTAELPGPGPALEALASHKPWDPLFLASYFVASHSYGSSGDC